MGADRLDQALKRLKANVGLFSSLAALAYFAGSFSTFLGASSILDSLVTMFYSAPVFTAHSSRAIFDSDSVLIVPQTTLSSLFLIDISCIQITV